MEDIGIYIGLLLLGTGYGFITSTVLFLLGFGIYKALSLLNIKN